jgi:hypothetical protein
MAGVGNRRFVGVGIRRKGAWAIAPAADCEPSQERFEEGDEKERGEGVTL